MPRRSTKYDLAAIYAYLEEHPGIRKTTLARYANCSRNPDSLLVLLECQGFILSEDESGGLYPFRRVKVVDGQQQRRKPCIE